MKIDMGMDMNVPFGTKISLEYVKGIEKDAGNLHVNLPPDFADTGAMILLALIKDWRFRKVVFQAVELFSTSEVAQIVKDEGL